MQQTFFENAIQEYLQTNKDVIDEGKLNIYDTKVVNVTVSKLNLDEECREDLLSGMGIRISNPEAFGKVEKKNGKGEKKAEKIYNGLQSPFFGTDFSDDLAFSERYSCKCKHYIGKMYLDQICPECGTPVQYVDVDMRKTGWIILNDFKVISPIYNMKLQDALGTLDGEKVLMKIIHTGFSDDISEFDEKELQNLTKCPFLKKGMTWLSEHLVEVLDFYAPKKPSKKALFDELYADIDRIFTHCIPVFSSVLRIESPGEKNEKLYKIKVNTIYQSIIKSVNNVNALGPIDEISDKSKFIADRYLRIVQNEITDLFTEIFNILNGKKGVIQGRIISGRYNFSARNIIICDSGLLRSDEVELCYLSMIELFRYEIINMYSKLYSCSIKEAHDAWTAASTRFDPCIYRIMNSIIQPGDGKYAYVMINRPPSINFGSFLAMRIARVKPDINDKTMTLNSKVIKTMAADFDGDQLHIWRIIGADFGHRFSKNMNPRYNLNISRINGRTNKAMMPQKDEVIGFWLFNNA